MKRRFALLAAALLALTCKAQDAKWEKMNPHMQITVNNFTKNIHAKRTKSIGQPIALMPTALLVQVAEGVNADSLMSRYDAKALTRHGNLMMISVSPDSIAPLSLSNHIERMEMMPTGEVQNDKSRLVTGVDMAYSASGELPHAFTGKGVVAGIVDVGFDFGHVTFLDNEGKTRFKKFWDLGVESDKSDDEKPEWEYWGTIYDSREEIEAARHSSDALKQNHGTHVLGTMAGGGTPDGKWRGMAPDAEIIGAMSPLGARLFKYDGDNQILRNIYNTANFDVLSMDFIFSQAKAENKPCVINYSICAPEATSWVISGTLMEQYLQQITGPGCIVVASMGNFGTYSYVYAKKQADKPMRLHLSRETANPFFYFKPDDIDSLPIFKISFMADTLTVDLNDIDVYIAKKLNYPNTNDSVTVMIERNLFMNNGEKQLCFVFYLEMSDIIKSISNKTLNKSQLHIAYEGNSSASFMTCITSYLMINNADEGDGSIFTDKYTCNLGNPASFDCVIGVGVTVRTDLSGESGGYGELKDGTIWARSSRGPTWDGRMKPDISAPGYHVVSAQNRYVQNNAKPYDTTVVDGETYEWVVNGGTSMASPCVAGIIALWLEADPTLSPDDIKKVFAKTATHTDNTLDYPNITYGYGEINAYAGLLEILGLNASVPSISSSQPNDVSFSVNGKNIDIVINGHDNSAYTVTVYSTDGKLIKSIKSTDSCVSIDLGAVPTGVYAVQLNTSERRTTGSTLVRI